MFLQVQPLRVLFLALQYSFFCTKEMLSSVSIKKIYRFEVKDKTTFVTSDYFFSFFPFVSTIVKNATQFVFRISNHRDIIEFHPPWLLVRTQRQNLKNH